MHEFPTLQQAASPRVYRDAPENWLSVEDGPHTKTRYSSRPTLTKRSRYASRVESLDSMARPRSRSTPPRPTSAMERHVAGVCECLKENVYLLPSQASRCEASDVYSLPVPWISVSFQAESAEYANCKDNPRQTAQHGGVSVTPDTNNSIRSTATDKPCAQGVGDDPHAYEKLVAIRFLSLVACYPEYSWRGNPRFWWHVLSNACGFSRCDEFFSLDREPRVGRRREVSSCAPARSATEVHEMPKFQLVFSKLKINNELLALIAESFSPDSNKSFRHVDHRARELLARLRIVIPRSPQTVMINLDFSQSQLRMLKCANGIEFLLKTASGRDGTASRLTKVFFKVQCLDLSANLVSERDLTALAQILALPELSVNDLRLSRVFTLMTSKRFMRSFCELMSACFTISLSGGGVDIPRTSLAKLVLNSCRLNNFQLASIFSAIHVGNNSQRGVRELSLQGFEGGDSWLWLAYGILHPASKSHITNLDISYCVLRFEDIELVRDVLGSAYYGSYLMPKKPSQTCLHDHGPLNQWALVAAGSRLEIPREASKHANRRSKPALKLEAALWCHVLESGKSWTCVMVPAYGILYVKNSKIVRTKIRFDTSCSGTTQQQQQHQQLETLTMVGIKTASQVLQIGDDGELVGPLGSQPIDRVLLEWLQVIGQPLRTLNLRNNSFASCTLGAVLESCPFLTELDIGGCELTDITPITRAFRRGSSVLRTLKADQNHISAASQKDLFSVLGDAECTAIRNLQSLHLEENPTSPENRILNTLHSSLMKNRTLRYLAMSMDEKDVHAKNVEYRFEKYHHGKWLGYEELPLERRLALLSVSMVITLPTAVIEIILDFARLDVYREILWV